MATPTNPQCKICKRQPGRCINHDLTPEQKSARSRKGFYTRLQENPEGTLKHLVNAGKAGFAATVTSSGRSTALDKLRERRLKNPSSYEQTFMDILDEFMIVYDREQWVPGTHMTVDFVLRGNGVAFTNHLYVEVDGLPFSNHDFERDERMAAKRKIITELGYEFLILTADQIDSWVDDLLNSLRKVGYLG